MNIDNALIDEIVGNVMRELGSGTAGSHSAPNVQASFASPVVIASHVITEDILTNAKAVAGTVVVPPGAVVTPSGRDYIRRQQLTLTHDTSQSNDGSSAAAGLMIMAVQSTAFSTAASTVGWEITTAECAQGLAQQAVTSAASGQHAVTCCRQPSLTACMINRDANRRAAVVTPQMSTDQLLRQMNPDVLCVSPDGWSLSGTVRLMKQLTAAALAVPSNWKELSQ